jgi:hypothetical protein
MHPDTRLVAHHMKEFGLSMLGRAIYDVTFSELSAPFAHALAVVHGAHGAEIVLKARIAEEHPLLMFSKLPKQSTTTGNLTIAELFEHGRSFDYYDLPDLLWAATGHRMERLDDFKKFGELRNQIVHLAVPEIDLVKTTLSFCIEVMEPILDNFWKESAIPYAEQWDDALVSDGYLLEQIELCKITIPHCAKKYLATS